MYWLPKLNFRHEKKTPATKGGSAFDTHLDRLARTEVYFFIQNFLMFRPHCQ
jgi:hypothetical protein